MPSFLKRLWPWAFRKDRFVLGSDGNPVRISAGGIVVGPDGRIIVVHQHSDSWSLPKGGVENNENLEQGARREIFEETGISDLTLVEELGTYERYSIAKGGVGENHDFPIGRRTFFLFKTNQTDFVPTDGEIAEARWVTYDEAMAIVTHPRDKEFLSTVKNKVLESPHS